MNPLQALVARSAVASVALLSCAVDAAAQDPDHTAEMRQLGDCHGCVIDGQDFSDRSLMGINMSDARLTATLFKRARLGIAIFDGATLTGVNFDGANLRGASFVGARLVDVTFAQADMRGAVFEGAILEHTDLKPGLLCNTQMPDDEMDNSDCD